MSPRGCMSSTTCGWQQNAVIASFGSTAQSRQKACFGKRWLHAGTALDVTASTTSGRFH